MFKNLKINQNNHFIFNVNQPNNNNNNDNSLRYK